VAGAQRHDEQAGRHVGDVACEGHEEVAEGDEDDGKLG
jgi:hypothetical protein